MPKPKIVSVKQNDFVLSDGIQTAEPIESVAEFVNLTSRLSFVRPVVNGKPLLPILFRGQYRNTYELMPRIGRDDFNYSDAIERHLLQEFKRRSTPYAIGTTQPRNELEWLGLAQHHRLATRLLDWTESGFAALWFATQEWITDTTALAKQKDAVVWVFLPDESDFLTDQEMEQSPFDFKKTKVFRPRHFADRVRAQSGWFTVHKYRDVKSSFLALERNSEIKPKLYRIPIKAATFRGILRDLAQNGVSAASIFPDLVGLSDYLNYSVQRP
jgi:hypothetical protein